MAIRKSWVPGVPGPTYCVVGDPRMFRQFSTRQAAEQREAELAAGIDRGTVWVTSFGHLHDAPPAADRVVDVRPFRDPHAAAHLRHLTADDEQVRDAVMATPGVPELVREIAGWANERGKKTPTMTIAVGCAGGRHRASTVAREVAARLRDAGHTVIVRHRDIDKPVVQRAT